MNSCSREVRLCKFTHQPNSTAFGVVIGNACTGQTNRNYFPGFKPTLPVQYNFQNQGTAQMTTGAKASITDEIAQGIGNQTTFLQFQRPGNMGTMPQDQISSPINHRTRKTNQITSILTVKFFYFILNM